MQVNEKNVLERNLDIKKQLDILMSMEEFRYIFLELFLKESLNEMIYREGSSAGVIKALDARKAFNDFLYDIIDEGDKAKEILKEL